MAEPMYRRIAEDLRQQIELGEVEPAQQLRTELELREHYGASRNTVRDAIKWLTTLGLVETRPGQGTFVVRKIDPYVTTLTTDPKTGPGGDITAMRDRNESGGGAAATTIEDRVANLRHGERASDHADHRGRMDG